MTGAVIKWSISALSVLGGAILIEHYGGAASYLLFYTTLLLPVLVFAYRRIAAASIYVLFSAGKGEMIKGEKCVCTLSIQNSGILPFPRVEISLTGGKHSFSGYDGKVMCSLRPGEIIKIPLELSCNHCGKDLAGAESVRVYDIFGFGCKTFSQKAAVFVRPRMPRLKTLSVAPGEQRERQRNIREYKPAEVPDGQIRPYEYGDSLKKVHWKATARQGKLMMRSFVTEPKTRVTVIPDSRRELPDGETGWDIQDCILEGTLAIADYYRRMATPTRVLLSGGVGVNVTSGGEYARLYELCCGDFFSGEQRADLALETELHRTGASGSFIVITWELDTDFVRRLSMAAELGARVSVLYLCDNRTKETMSLINSDRRIDFHIVPTGGDILDFLGGAEAVGGGTP